MSQSATRWPWRRSYSSTRMNAPLVRPTRSTTRANAFSICVFSASIVASSLHDRFAAVDRGRRDGPSVARRDVASGLDVVIERDVLGAHLGDRLLRLVDLLCQGAPFLGLGCFLDQIDDEVREAVPVPHDVERLGFRVAGRRGGGFVRSGLDVQNDRALGGAACGFPRSATSCRCPTFRPRGAGTPFPAPRGRRARYRARPRDRRTSARLVRPRRRRQARSALRALPRLRPIASLGRRSCLRLSALISPSGLDVKRALRDSLPAAHLGAVIGSYVPAGLELGTCRSLGLPATTSQAPRPASTSTSSATTNSQS